MYNGLKEKKVSYFQTNKNYLSLLIALTQEEYKVGR